MPPLIWAMEIHLVSVVGVLTACRSFRNQRGHGCIVVHALRFALLCLSSPPRAASERWESSPGRSGPRWKRGVSSARWKTQTWWRLFRWGDRRRPRRASARRAKAARLVLSGTACCRFFGRRRTRRKRGAGRGLEATTRKARGFTNESSNRYLNGAPKHIPHRGHPVRKKAGGTRSKQERRGQSLLGGARGSRERSSRDALERRQLDPPREEFTTAPPFSRGLRSSATI